MPRASAWVSKLVQAACGWGCAQLDANATAKLATFHFTFKDLTRMPDEQAIVNRLLSPVIGSQEPLECLAVAVRSVVEQQGLSFLLVIDNGEAESRSIYAGKVFNRLRDSDRLSSKYRLGIGLSLTISHPHLGMFSRFTGRALDSVVEEELSTRAFCSPVPLYYKGRRIDGTLSLIRKIPGCQLFPLYFSGVTNLESCPPVLRAFERTVTQRFSIFGDERVNLCQGLEGGDEPFSALFLLAAHLPESVGPPHRIPHQTTFFWISQGAVIETFTLRQEATVMSCYFFLNAEGLQTDLTGIQLVKDRAFNHRKKQAIKEIGPKIIDYEPTEHALTLKSNTPYLASRHSLWMDSNLASLLQQDKSNILRSLKAHYHGAPVQY